jgi:hypothetical protein
MPVDTKAKYYTWFMEDDPTSRIVGYEWWPEGEIISSLTLGNLVFKHRKDPGDVWEPGMQVAKDILWVVAQNLTRSEGFHIEVPVFKGG